MINKSGPKIEPYGMPVVIKGTCNHSVENALKYLKFPHTIKDRML